MARRRGLPLLLLLAACGAPATGPSVGPDDPILAPVERWTWVGFAGSSCGSGAPTGIGVNLTARSSDVVVYFQGGGACWDAVTCLAQQSAAHLLSGYGAADFTAEPDLAATAFDRTVAANPFKDASFVFVPYCTGDLHAGDALQVYRFGATVQAVAHQGGRNTGLFLRRLATTFPGARRVFVAGSSAGGYAAQLNFPRFVEAFPAAEVHALADGAQLVQPGGTLYATWQAAWRLSPPAGCAACATRLPALASWLTERYPASRFALLASTRDGVLPPYLALSSDELDTATRDLLATAYDPSANARYFTITSSAHTMLGTLTTTTSAAGVPLSAWLARWYAGDPVWASTGP